MATHPVLHWDYVADWAKQNKVPDHAIVQAEDGSDRNYNVIAVQRGHLIITMAPDPLPLTWAELRGSLFCPAGTTMVTASVTGSSDVIYIRDLSHYEEGRGADYLILQARYH